MAINNYNFKREAELTDKFIQHLQDRRTDLVLSKADEVYLPKILKDPRVIELKREIKRQNQIEKERQKDVREAYNNLYDSFYGQILKIKSQAFRGPESKYRPLYGNIANSDLLPKDKATLKVELDKVIASLPTNEEYNAQEILISAKDAIFDIRSRLSLLSSIAEVDGLQKETTSLPGKWAKMMLDRQLPKKVKTKLKGELSTIYTQLSADINKRKVDILAYKQQQQQIWVKNDLEELNNLQFDNFQTFGEFRDLLKARENAIKLKVSSSFHKKIEAEYKMHINLASEHFFSEKLLEIPISSIRHENKTYSYGLTGTYSKLTTIIQGAKFRYSIADAIEKIIDLSNREGIVLIAINPTSLTFTFPDKSDLDKILSGGAPSSDPTIITIPWNNIRFDDNRIRIQLPQGGALWVDASCRTSYNAIKTHLASTLPQIKVKLNEKGKYVLAEPIILDNAVQIIRRSADADDLYSTAKADFGKWMCNPTFIAAINFTLSDAHQEYLLRRLHSRKQKYIESLIKKQHKEYRLIPAMESLSHISGASDEEAFIFTLPCRNPLYVYLVYENLNIARATIVCKVEKQEYNYCLKTLYNHMANGSYINKRQELQWHPRKLCKGMISIKSVNHIESIFNWSRNLY